MPTQVLIAIGALSIALPMLGWALFSRPSRAQQHAVVNLQRGLRPSTESRNPIAISVSADQRKRSLAQRLIPAGTVRRVDRLAARAGRPAAWPVKRLLAAKLVLAVVAAVLGLFYVARTGNLPAVLVVAGIVVGVYFLPELLLYNAATKRNEIIALELPDTLDQMTIAVEAGLCFESAMAQAGRNGTGPLAEELVRTLQDIEMGRTRREAYESLGDRTNVEDLRRFTRAVIQADDHGIAIADVLNTQAAEMRVKRRMRAEEKAMKIPVKVIFPLMLCILPVLFIVVMGPAAMNIMTLFGSM
jgi:tight adherence protein C